MNETANETTIQTDELLTNLLVMVVGDNHGWGKAPLIEDAIRRAGRPKRYIAYLIHPDTRVHEVDGSLMYPDGYKPLVISRKGLTGIRRS